MTDGPGAEALARAEEVEIAAGSVVLDGRLVVPPGAGGLVVFVHGSGSSRRSPRNRFVADSLNRRGLATLLFDLLTVAEETDRANVFDVGLLVERLEAATSFVVARPDTAALRFGYFGASTGAAAALATAALRPESGAVVSRGGRPDLAAPWLESVRAPTLLIVGGRDEVVLDLNRQAFERLTCERDLVVVPGATHLFEEPGALDQVAELAGAWFERHLVAG